MKKGWIIGIIVLVVLIAFIVLKNLFLCFGCRNYPDFIYGIDSDIKKDIDNLFYNENKNLVILGEVSITGLDNEKTIKAKQGTENLEIPIGYSPDNPLGFDIKRDCKYSINVENIPGDCSESGWLNPENSIITGANNVAFDEANPMRGYALIKINILEDLAPCLQKFKVDVECEGYKGDTASEYFNIRVIKRIF